MKAAKFYGDKHYLKAEMLANAQHARERAEATNIALMDATPSKLLYEQRRPGYLRLLMASTALC